MNHRPRAQRAALLFVLAALISGALGAQAAPQAAATQVFLPLVARGGVPDPGPDPSPGGPSSDELIAEALARGEIDAEAALTYRTFAAFADPRLPARFRGDDSAPGDDDLLPELFRRFDQLSPAAQSTLRPFTIPPYHKGSWWDLRRGGASPAAAPAAAPAADGPGCLSVGDGEAPILTDWSYVDGGKARVWWQKDSPGDAARAKEYAFMADVVWDRLKELMGREPPSDGGDLLPCRGGDDRLDISIVELKGDFGAVGRHAGQLPVASSSYMMLNRKNFLPGNVQGTLIHEMMHVFQNAFPISNLDDYAWWQEATAEWAVHYVEGVDPEPDTNQEHHSANAFLSRPKLPLEAAKWRHDYGAYLFPFFVQLRTGKPDLVRLSFERAGSIGNSLENLNGLLDGGFRKQWPEFTLRNLNTPPADDYARDDGLQHKGTLLGEHEVKLEGERMRSYALDGNVGHLAGHAYRFTFTDATARSLVFHNPFAQEGVWPTAAVRALVKVGGQWREEDWTTFKTRALCRDLVAERVEELYVVVSNSEHADREHELKPATPPRLDASNVACRGWQGVVRYHDWYRDEVMEGVYLSEQTIDFETSVTLRLTPAPLGLFGGALHFSPDAGTTIKLHLHGWSLGDGEPPRVCTYDDRVSAPIVVERSRLLIFGDTGAYGAEGDMPEITVGGGDSCDSSGSIKLRRSWWLVGDGETSQVFVSPDGTKISGRFDKVKRSDNPNGEIYYTWELTALPPE
jgi:hypothetical protein